MLSRPSRSGPVPPIAKRSTIFDVGDIVWVPFPFVEAPRLRDRPALVIGRTRAEDDAALLRVLMITSAANGGLRDDISLIGRFAECGLAMPYVVRTTKIWTVEQRSAKRTGALPEDILRRVRKMIVQHVAL